jgi:hypothetical protein
MSLRLLPKCKRKQKEGVPMPPRSRAEGIRQLQQEVAQSKCAKSYGYDDSTTS